MMTEAEKLCARVPESLRPHAVELAENLLFLEGRLRDDREHLANMADVIPYDNGGGQTGIRRNPLIDAYNANLRSFTSALSTLVSILGDVNDVQAESTLERFKIISMQKVANA